MWTYSGAKNDRDWSLVTLKGTPAFSDGEIQAAVREIRRSGVIAVFFGRTS